MTAIFSSTAKNNTWGRLGTIYLNNDIAPKFWSEHRVGIPRFLSANRRAFPRDSFLPHRCHDSIIPNHPYTTSRDSVTYHPSRRCVVVRSTFVEDGAWHSCGFSMTVMSLELALFCILGVTSEWPLSLEGLTLNPPDDFIPRRLRLTISWTR